MPAAGKVTTGLAESSGACLWVMTGLPVGKETGSYQVWNYL